MIRKLRRAKDITQRELAELLGVDRTAISKWEQGVALPRGKTLIRLTEILECSADDLLKGVARSEQ